MTPRDVAASVHARLLNLVRSRGEDFQALFNRYARERLLYRLAQSPYRDRFVLKGATLFSVWAEKPFRSTKDADFLGFGPSDVDSMAAIFRDLCDAEPDADDGLRFDPESVQAAQIREEEEYEGVRVHLTALLGRSRVQVQVDIGFGDAITPETEEIQLPVLLDLPAPHLRAYPKETVIAEKLQAMTVLATTNSRMKDFYDVWILQQEFPFGGVTLSEAIKATFERRRTAVDPASCVAFQSAFYVSAAPLNLWRAYVLRGGLERVPPPFASVGEAITAFLRPVAERVAAGLPFDRVWPPGGPWREKEDR
jgi:predicted nucleotidyltransferase component of viral defense system